MAGKEPINLFRESCGAAGACGSPPVRAFRASCGRRGGPPKGPSSDSSWPSHR